MREALSEDLELEIWRDGATWQQNYSKGEPTNKLKKTGATKKRGTKVHFLPDRSIFTATEYNYDTLAQRLRELAFLNKGLLITLTDERATDLKTGEPKQTDFKYNGGIADFLFEVLCPTGCSAVNVQGITLHSLFCWRNNGKSARGFGSFFGLAVGSLAAGKISDEALEEKMSNPGPRYRGAVKRIKELGVICFDEFSMISGEHLKAMDRITKAIKGESSKTFGGIQIIMCGYLFQNLPPQGKAPFAVPLWRQLELSVCEIQADRLYRFTSSEFSDMTRMLRLGIVSNVVELKLMERTQESPEKVMELYFTNKDAEKYNLVCYADLKTEEVVYPSTLSLQITMLHEDKDKQLTPSKPVTMDVSTTGKFTAEVLAGLEESAKQVIKHANEQLDQYRRILGAVYGADYMAMRFKTGARVICTVNHKENGKLEYCNGSAGTIEKCLGEERACAFGR